MKNIASCVISDSVLSSLTGVSIHELNVISGKVRFGTTADDWALPGAASFAGFIIMSSGVAALTEEAARIASALTVGGIALTLVLAMFNIREVITIGVIVVWLVLYIFMLVRFTSSAGALHLVALILGSLFVTIIVTYGLLIAYRRRLAFARGVALHLILKEIVKFNRVVETLRVTQELESVRGLPPDSDNDAVFDIIMQGRQQLEVALKVDRIRRDNSHLGNIDHKQLASTVRAAAEFHMPENITGGANSIREAALYLADVQQALRELE